MSGNRQSMALGFLFLALVAFEQHQIIAFVLLTLVASLFHASAVLMLPIGLLSFTRNGPVRALLLLTSSVLGFYLLRGTFSVYVSRYSLDKIQSTGIWYRLAMNALPAAVFLSFQRRFSFEEHERILWRNLSILSIAVAPLVFIIPSSTALDRIILYFFPLQFAVFTRLPYSLDTSRKSIGSSIMVVIAYAAAIQLVFLSFGKFASYYVPYHSIL
jgi:hypothetical protein